MDKTLVIMIVSIALVVGMVAFFIIRNEILLHRRWEAVCDKCMAEGMYQHTWYATGYPGQRVSDCLNILYESGVEDCNIAVDGYKIKYWSKSPHSAIRIAKD